MATFFRPEALRLLARWAETAALGAAVALLLSYVLFWSGFSEWLRIGLALAIGLIGIWLVRSAVLSALSEREGEAPGVVNIDERRISFFGPHVGGVVSLNDLRVIEVATEAPEYWQYEAQWILRGSEPEALVIPVTAVGASGLIDAFSALPGFSPTRALSALSAAPGNTVTIWQRQGSEARTALEQPPTQA